MFSLEFSSGRPLGSAPYYSLVVRGPYIVGRSRESDIMLDQLDISQQHASLTVLRKSQMKGDLHPESEKNHKEDTSGTDGGSGVVGSFLDDAHGVTQGHVASWTPHDLPCLGKKGPSSSRLQENDPLMLLVTKLQSDVCIVANGAELSDKPVYLADGSQLQFGAHVRLSVRFRPLVVNISRNAFSADYVEELEFMYHRLGATLTQHPKPTNKLDMPQPIGMLLCVETIGDDPWCLSALAMGYSIVHPTYVVEWFAALAQSASSPLSVLPPPVRFEVPIRCYGVTAHTAFYLRPESDVCPFPLYQIPTTATLKRTRDTLFEGRKFFFLTNAVEKRYEMVVPLCGGEVHRLDDVANVAVMQQYAAASAEKEEPKNNGNSLPTHYAVIDLDMEHAIKHGDSCVQAAVQHLLDNTEKAGIQITIISERSLFHSLLTNRFSALEVVRPPVFNTCTQNENNTGHQSRRENWCGNLASAGAESGMKGMVTGVADLSIIPKEPAGWNVEKAPHSSRRPVTPCKDQAQIMSKSKKREKMATERVALSRSGRNSPSGRRGSSPLRSTCSLSVSDLCGVLRQRVRTFIGKEEYKLLGVLAGSRRNLFVDSEDMEYARECRSHAMRHIETAERLLMDLSPESHFTEELHSFQEDCREMLRRAQAVIDCAEYAARRSQSWNRVRHVPAENSQVRRYMSPVSTLRVNHSVQTDMCRDGDDCESTTVVRSALRQSTPPHGALSPPTPLPYSIATATKSFSGLHRDKPRSHRKVQGSNTNDCTPQNSDTTVTICTDLFPCTRQTPPRLTSFTQRSLKMNSPVSVHARSTPRQKRVKDLSHVASPTLKVGQLSRSENACEGSVDRPSKMLTCTPPARELMFSSRRVITPQRVKTPRTSKSSTQVNRSLQLGRTPSPVCTSRSKNVCVVSSVPTRTFSSRQ